VPSAALYGRASHPYTRALQTANAADPDERFKLRDAAGPEATSEGCVLAARCPFAEARCRAETPVLRRFGASTVACHRAEEIADA
jgi:oligopeptide/dipeptide ABC transporter ATP-binding protein